MNDESEKVENNVDAKSIRDKLLKALHLGPGEFATAIGIHYQRIYDIGSGRTKSSIRVWSTRSSPNFRKSTPHSYILAKASH